jgi:hypothetical protein
MFIGIARHLDVGDGLKGQDIGIKRQRALHIRHGHAHGIDRLDPYSPANGLYQRPCQVPAE